MPKQTQIKFINDKSLHHDEIVAYYKTSLELLDEYAILINDKSNVDKLFANPFEIINNYALVIIDSWFIEKNYDWNAFVNKIFTHPEKEDQNCNIIIITKYKLSKPTLRAGNVKIINIK